MFQTGSTLAKPIGIFDLALPDRARASRFRRALLAGCEISQHRGVQCAWRAARAGAVPAGRSASPPWANAEASGWPQLPPCTSSLRAPMAVFEIVIALLLVGAVLAAVARRLNAPYPALLALAGAALALLPNAPERHARSRARPDAARGAGAARRRIRFFASRSQAELARGHRRWPWSRSGSPWRPWRWSLAGSSRAALGRGDRARRHRGAARRGGGDRGAAPAPPAAPGPGDPRGREPVQRRERAAGLSAGGRRGRDRRHSPAGARSRRCWSSRSAAWCSAPCSRGCSLWLDAADPRRRRPP